METEQNAERVATIQCWDCWPHSASDCACMVCNRTGRVKDTPEARRLLERVRAGCQVTADTAGPNTDLRGGLRAALEVCEDQAKALVQQGVSETDDAVYLRDCVVSAIEKLLEHLSLIDGDE